MLFGEEKIRYAVIRCLSSISSLALPLPVQVAEPEDGVQLAFVTTVWAVVGIASARSDQAGIACILLLRVAEIGPHCTITVYFLICK